MAAPQPTDDAGSGADAGEGNWAARLRRLAIFSPALSRLHRYAILSCLGLLVIGVGVWLAIVIPDRLRHAALEPQRSPEEIAREREARVKEAEKTATWQDAHCKMLYAYYQGPEPDLPLAELLGMSADADEVRVKRRCTDLLAAVRLLGGWPTAKPQQDNFVVCTGFRFELTGSFRMSVRITPVSLATDEILFGVPGEETHRQTIFSHYAVAIGSYLPMVVRADDGCVAIGVRRMGRRRDIPGRIVRDVPAE